MRTLHKSERHPYLQALDWIRIRPHVILYLILMGVVIAWTISLIYENTTIAGLG